MNYKNSLAGISRRIGKILLIIILLLSVTSFSVVRWTESQFLNTNNWVNTVGPLPKDPVISSAIGLYVSSQVFNSVDVQKKIADALPPKASFLAAPLSDQLKDLVKKISTKVVSSDAFQTVWITANRRALDSQIQVARGHKKPALSEKTQKISINIEAVKKQIASKLGASSEIIPIANDSSKKPLAFVADLQVAPKIFQRTIKQIDFTHSILPYLMVSSFLGALALSYNRAKTAFRLATACLAIYLVKIISLKITIDQLLNNVSNQAYVPALSKVIDVFTVSLLNIIYSMIAVFATIMLISLLFGPSKMAVKIRKFIKLDAITKSPAYNKFIGARTTVKTNLWKISIGIGLLILLGLAMSSNPTLILGLKSLLGGLAILSVLYIYANPKSV